MSEENVEIVRAWIEAFNRGDWDAAVSNAAPDFELDMSGAIGPLRGVYGLHQSRALFNDVLETWESSRIEADELIESGDHVVVPWTFFVRGRDGIEAQARTTWLFTIRDGAIGRVCMYQERQDALKAAGLSE